MQIYRIAFFSLFYEGKSDHFTLLIRMKLKLRIAPFAVKLLVNLSSSQNQSNLDLTILCTSIQGGGGQNPPPPNFGIFLW